MSVYFDPEGDLMTIEHDDKPLILEGQSRTPADIARDARIIAVVATVGIVAVAACWVWLTLKAGA